MSRTEYLRSAISLYNSGRIDAEVFDTILLNADAFCEDDDDGDE